MSSHWLSLALAGCLALVLGIELLFGQVDEPQVKLRDQTCSFEVRAYDPYGTRLSDVSVSTGASKAMVQPGQKISVPCGLTRIQVQRVGFGTSTRNVEVDEEQQLVTFSLGLDGPAHRNFAGEIADYDSMRGCDVLRLIPALPFDDATDVRVSKGGRFEVDQLRYGTYIALLTGDEGVCGQTFVRLNGDTRGTLNLKLSKVSESPR
jgi:hypothetical protein